MSHPATPASQTPDLMTPPSALAPVNHGRTAAAWTLFWGCVVGTSIGAVGAVMNNWTVIAVAIAVCVVVIAVSAGMRIAGLGQPRETPAPATLIPSRDVAAPGDGAK